MRRAVGVLAPAALALGAFAGGSACASSGATAAMREALAPVRTTAAERGAFVGAPEHFTGRAVVRLLFAPDGPRDFGGASVCFDPGARTVWHAHPAGQTLVVTDGRGWMQLEGGPRLALEPGDVVWTPPAVRHWHGAAATVGLTHLALQGEVDGSMVAWGEPVSEAQYAGDASE